MDALIASGNIVLWMLGFVAVEVIGLWIYWNRTGGGIAPLPLLVNVGAGSSIMVALYCFARGADWRVVAGWLVLSLLFHTADLKQRWSQGRVQS